MTQECLMYFTSAGHDVYRRAGSALVHEASFHADAPGEAEFRAFLSRRRRGLFRIVADLSGEDFHEDQIPYVRGSDRAALLERRLAQRYRDLRLAAAFSLGQVTGERRNERILLASFSNAQQFAPWLDALAESGIKLAGVYSVPLLAPVLAAALGMRDPRVLLITVTRAGLRQCFLDNGRLRFARLERCADVPPAELGAFVRSESVRLAQYLGMQRALPRGGPPLRAIVVAPPGKREAFGRALTSDEQITFETVDAERALRAAGLKHVPREAGAEALFLMLASRKAPREQFARHEERHGFKLWQLRRAIVAAGALGLAACSLYAGSDWLAARNLEAQAAMARRDAQNMASEYRRVTAALPVTRTSTENLKATVSEFNRLVAQTPWPEGALAQLARVVDGFPQIQLESLLWRVARPEAPAGAAQAAATAGPAADAERRAELLEISGRIQMIRRSDYRGIAAELRRFGEAACPAPACRLVRAQLPFDLTPEGVLTGDVSATEEGDETRFTLVLERALK